MSSETCIVLVRHAESRPDPAVPEPAWPLSERGRAQALALADAPEFTGVARVVASPYLRAQDTVRLLAERLGLPLETEADLREQRLSATPLPDRDAQLRRGWADPDRALPGGESGRAVQTRMIRCLTALAFDGPGTTLVACSHGQALARFLDSIDPAFGYEGWAAMGNPHLFRVVHRDGRWRRTA